MKLFRQWFGFTKKEQRASLILIIIISIVVCIRFIIPNSKVSADYLLIEKELIKNDTVQQVPAETPVRSAVQNRTPAARQIIMIEINSCDSTELLRLPGIGAVLSSRIVRYRNLLGGFASTDQLQEVYGLRPETFNTIKDMVTVDTTLIDKINVNTADFRRLSRLPYFERQEINDLLRYRNTNGQIHNINELIENSILSDDKAAKIKPYLSFSD